MPAWLRAWRLLIKILGLALFTLQAIRHIAAFRPDILHIHTHLPIGLAPFAKLLSAKVVVTIHGTDLMALQKSGALAWLYDLAVDEIWFVSRAMVPSLEKLFPTKKKFYTPSGVDQSIFRPRTVPRRDQVVTVGRLVWQKDHSTLLTAFREVVRRVPNSKLVIIGDGPDRDNLEAQINAYGLGDAVRLAGVLPQEDIAQELAVSKLFVLSSVAEGFPKVLLEALSCGLPLIVTDAGSCRELVEDYEVGLVVPTQNAERLADAIATMLSEDSMWKQAASNAPQAAAGYGWEALATHVSTLYFRLIEPRPSHQAM